MSYVEPAQPSRLGLGIGVGDATNDWCAHHGYKGAILVYAVLENTPASRAGLQKNDVIVGIDGQPVGVSKDFPSMLKPMGGKNCKLLFYRGEEKHEVAVDINRV